MLRKLLILWAVLSLASLLTGFIWKNSDSENHNAYQLYFIGWMSTLLVVGYLSTPSDSVFGKVAFGFVVFTVAGIAWKVLHLTGANEAIVIGLLGITATYAVMWFGKKVPR
jgi:hypothetical protein